ncbi:hypothetical protein F511_24137 [Dorcoceras hygrometricum]|uniref:Dystroglycan-like n=1 Tax=Dorcoceras hygrometricum TaxID=472368 RepID=A0A2Z7CYD0_9LAMI|nr:hypothetical protein F511_24137 [Dorcoceras hygrometricum]
MASSLISNSHHIDFDAVFGMEDTDMVQMFESLIATGLKNFLGCSAVFNEAALTEFFTNSSVGEDGFVVSTVNGVTVEISEEVFAATFELPVEGLTDLSDVPKNLVYDARIFFSISKEQVSISCLKKAMKIEYHLLHDILAKTIYVKAGSFDSVTKDRFMLMTAITFYVKINWSSLLFGVLREMVTPGSHQAKGYAIQICVLLRNVPGLELEESKPFPIHNMLNEKTVHRHVVINDKLGGEEVSDEPKVKRTPAKKKGVTKKRPAAGQYQNMVAAKVLVLLRLISEDMMLPSVTAAEITKIRLGESINIPGVQECDLFYASLHRISIHDKGKEPLLRNQVMQDVVDFFHSFSLNKLSDLESLKILKEKEKLMLEWAETDSLEMAVKRKMYILAKYRELLLRKFLDSYRKYFAPGQPWTAMAAQIIDMLSSAHSKSLDALQTEQKLHMTEMTQPGCSLSVFDSSAGSGTVLAQFYSVAKSTCWVRPMTLVDGVWTPLQGNDFWKSSCRLSLFVNRRQVPTSVVEEDFVTHGCMIEPVQYWGAAPSLIKTWGWARVCTNIIRYSMSEQLDFQAKISADLLSLSTQIGDIVDYIRGGDAKKGEGSSSRRPFPTPVHQAESSGNVARATEIISQIDIDTAQRDIMERYLRADRERDREKRERRLSRSGAYNRRRGH